MDNNQNPLFMQTELGEQRAVREARSAAQGWIWRLDLAAVRRLTHQQIQRIAEHECRTFPGKIDNRAMFRAIYLSVFMQTVIDEIKLRVQVLKV